MTDISQMAEDLLTKINEVPNVFILIANRHRDVDKGVGSLNGYRQLSRRLRDGPQKASLGQKACQDTVHGPA
jgi:hypothetical protein